MLSAAERKEMIASMVRDEYLIVCLEAIERKADIIRIAAANPPQKPKHKSPSRRNHEPRRAGQGVDIKCWIVIE